MSLLSTAKEVMPSGFLTLELASKAKGTTYDGLRMYLYRNPQIPRYRTGSQILVRLTDLEGMPVGKKLIGIS